MVLIAADEMLLKKPVPDHKRIIKILDEAISCIKTDSGSGCESDTKFKWSNSFRRSFEDFKRYSRLDSGSWKLNLLPSARQLTRRLSRPPSFNTVQE